MLNETSKKKSTTKKRRREESESFVELNIVIYPGVLPNLYKIAMPQIDGNHVLLINEVLWYEI